MLKVINSLLLSWGLSAADASAWGAVTVCAIALALSWAVYAVLNRLVVPVVLKFVNFTEARWDDIVFNPAILRVLSELAAVLVLRWLLPGGLADFPEWQSGVFVGLKIAIVCVAVHLVNRFIIALYNVLEENTSRRVTSLKGLRQMLQVISVFVGIIIVISILANRNPLTIITGLGAAATILMLVFKDPILGVVAGVQLTLNDMLRPGDWITVPARNLNGTVLEVGLTTVKVRNFDNTVVTVPPYSLVSESFQNWRPMQQSGARRVERSITIDVNTVAFCTPAQVEEYRREEWGRELDPAVKHVNLTVFRLYLEHYLSALPTLNTSLPDHICMVRELQPTPQGIPLDIYLFTSLTEWKPYEHFQADVLDHILASAPAFGLRVYQAPSGLDVRERTAR